MDLYIGRVQMQDFKQVHSGRVSPCRYASWRYLAVNGFWFQLHILPIPLMSPSWIVIHQGWGVHAWFQTHQSANPTEYICKEDSSQILLCRSSQKEALLLTEYLIRGPVHLNRSRSRFSCQTCGLFVYKFQEMISKIFI